MDIKDGLRLVLAETRAREAAELLPRCDDSPRPEGRWSVRDNLAHLAAWRDHAAHVLEAVHTGTPAPASSNDFDEENRKLFEASREMTAAEVRAEVDRSWDRLGAAMEACSEAELHDERPGASEQEVWQVVPGNAHGHLAEHLGYWYMEAGDPGGAEAAAIWAHDLDNRAFPTRRARANAAYNLGCFYARAGRAVDALPHLQLAASLHPPIVAWARQDGDLDPVRDDPRIAVLLS